MSDATYQKINWGWLNDYNGYKFAPITFVEQLYTEEGYSFKEKYNQKWESLEKGEVIAGAAKALVQLNDANEYEKITTQNNKPVYFNGGIPFLCDENLTSNLLGNINVLNQEEYKPVAIIKEEYTSGTYYSKVANGEYELDNDPFDANTVYYEVNPDYNENNVQDTIAFLLTNRDLADSVIKNYNSTTSREDLNLAINTYNSAQENLKDLTIINGGIINGNTITGNIIKATEKFEGNLEGNADTATILQTARALKIGETSKNFNGSKGLTWTHTEIGATVSNAWTNGDISGPTLVTTVNGVASSAVAIPKATDTQSGIITIEEQTFNGTKTFKGTLIINKAGYQLKMLHPELTYGTAPSAIKTSRITFEDSGGTAYGGLVNRIDTNNINRLSLTGYSPKADRDGELAYAQIYLEIDNDNNCVAGVRNGKNLRGDDASSESGGEANSIVFMGAAWNDYAEFRDQVIEVEPGYCVASTDDGKVYKTTKKFQACDGIVSDTYGFAIGKSDTYLTPLAVSGRVLAYCEGDRYNYHAGDTVCAGPGGKVFKMTREEIKEYPDRIIGIVSEIPEYEEWTGKKVNNRIWIKVR